jgi:uracil-DNA glycosylase
MPHTIEPELRLALAARIRYYNEMGIYDFYRRPVAELSLSVDETTIAISEKNLEPGEEMSPRKAATVAVSGSAGILPSTVAGALALSFIAPNPEQSLGEIALKPEQSVSDPVLALKVIREDLGDCTRCVLHKQGRKQIVFGVGNPNAELMFVGEGPGADEDEKGEPFVGRAGQLLNNMIKAMGIERESVYIANIVKCRPPGNRQPERDECATCSPFLMRQIAVVKPKVIVALGATAAKTLLAMNSSMIQLRGRFYDFRPTGVRSVDPDWDGCKLAVTYHPAFLLRDPRQKGEAWKDLQMVMKELGMKGPKGTT